MSDGILNGAVRGSVGSETLQVLLQGCVSCAAVGAALLKPREERTAADYGDWSFMAVFEDGDIAAFHREATAALLGSITAHRSGPLLETVNQWRISAAVWSDPVARAVLQGAGGGENQV